MWERALVQNFDSSSQRRRVPGLPAVDRFVGGRALVSSSHAYENFSEPQLGNSAHHKGTFWDLDAVDQHTHGVTVQVVHNLGQSVIGKRGGIIADTTVYERPFLSRAFRAVFYERRP
jgi:hypothetical protein